MAEKAGERVQKAIEKVVAELDKSKLRWMQVGSPFVVYLGLAFVSVAEKLRNYWGGLSQKSGKVQW